LKIQSLIERDGGGADVVLTDITPFELEALVQAGFVAMLERYAKEEQEKRKVPMLLRKEAE
jgi:hypothetical protein